MEKNKKESTTNSKKISAVATMDTKKRTSSRNKKVSAVKNIEEKKVNSKNKIKSKTIDVPRKSSVERTKAKVATQPKKAELKRIFRFGKDQKKYTVDRKQSKTKKKILYFDKKIKLDIIDLFTIVVSTVIMTCIVCIVAVNLYYKYNSVVIDRELAHDKELQSFISTYSDVVNNFYEEVDKKGMIEAATNGMLEHLADKYSIYLNKEEAEDFESSLNNTYQGIGILSIENVVYEVYPDSPADAAGIKAEDVIIKVNGVDIDKSNHMQISILLQEHDGENEIVVKRGDDELTFYVATAEVYKPAVSTNIFEKNEKRIGYISLETFSRRSFEEFELKLYKMEEEGFDSLILDLRNNSGGYIETAEHIASMFVKKGNLIYSLEKKNEKTDHYDETEEARDYKIVILINLQTASASELLTAALKDNNNAILVGTTTYGKGKVQTIMEHDGSLIKYTSSKWLRPNGECIDEVGIKPDYEVVNEIKNNVVYDKQFDKAIEILS